MSRTSTAIELRFEPPGPGSWEQDPVHFPRPMTRYWQETHPPAFKKGTNDFARFYGLLIDGLVTRYVNGFAYRQVVPASEAEIPERFNRAEQVFTKKLWREQLHDWDENQKPASIATHRKLQAVAPDALSDAELVEYLTRCRDHHAAMIAQHMRFTAGTLIPTGDFLAHAGDWTSLPPSELLGLMRGSAEVSAGGSDEMARLKQAFAGDPAARELLASEGDPAQVLAKLRSLGGQAGAALAGYLDLVGNRLVDGFDIAEPTALEMPDALLRAIRVAVLGETEATSVDARIAEVRAKVPALHRAEFDELLGEARLTYRLRDERGVYSDIWASGIMRRAALAAGRRVANRGRIASAQQMLDASLDEMCALVTGGGPSADELAKRADYRATYTSKDVPPSLGGPKSPPPDLAALPPTVARLNRAIMIALGHLFGSSQAQNQANVLYGLAASKGIYEGLARRVSGPSEFGRIVKGDVLITASTTEAFNILLPLLGGIVTDNGGLLSHAAIVSREYGIPGVVGTRDATEQIADGVRVRVDGDTGEVTILG
ncbi:MAG TPA: PEP-utilizing enzyme [Candidatus Limnocylindrales bacterium]|nr:PEP-utilizing enzyme [Candidatus Limnocylindrales bacterium]